MINVHFDLSYVDITVCVNFAVSKLYIVITLFMQIICCSDILETYVLNDCSLYSWHNPAIHTLLLIHIHPHHCHTIVVLLAFGLADFRPLVLFSPPRLCIFCTTVDGSRFILLNYFFISNYSNSLSIRFWSQLCSTRYLTKSLT